VLHIAENHAKLDNKVYTVTTEMDNRVAALKLKAMGFSIDRLSSEQEDYLHKA
jgi:adenosylhomocysteinase